MRHHAKELEKQAHTPEQEATFVSKNCSEASYRLTLSSDKFDSEKFSEALGSVSVSAGWHSVLIVARNPKVENYHAHVFWESDKDDPSKKRLQVDYHSWPREDDEEENHHVSADDFFDWASQYIKDATVNAHIHAEFEYPVERWQSRLLPLPTKVPFEDKQAIIDGYSVSLPSAPNGVSQAWVLRTNKKFKLQLYADRPLHFKKFTPFDDIDALNIVAKKLIGEKSL